MSETALGNINLQDNILRYAICGCTEDGQISPVENRTNPVRVVYNGLLWGSGSPELAGLRSRYWAVAKIGAFTNIVHGNLRAVRFEQFELVFHGKPAEALNTIIALGADPDQFSFDFSIAGENEVASTGEWGVAQSGDYGIANSRSNGWSQVGEWGVARAGCAGFADASAFGLAVADENGEAIAGEDGIAISDGKRFGSAFAGEGGIAIGRGRFKIVEAGAAGIAIAYIAGKATAGRRGIAVCEPDNAHVGQEGIAIGKVVSGGPGSYLVATRGYFEDGTQDFAAGIVGRGGVQPYTRYVCINGKLRPASDLTENER
jgi:hypothetical protein